MKILDNGLAIVSTEFLKELVKEISFYKVTISALESELEAFHAKGEAKDDECCIGDAEVICNISDDDVIYMLTEGCDDEDYDEQRDDFFSTIYGNWEFCCSDDCDDEDFAEDDDEEDDDDSKNTVSLTITLD